MTRRVLMTGIGVALVGAALLAAPTTGGAVVEAPAVPDPSLTTTSVQLPGEVDPVVKTIEGVTGSTLTTTSSTTTTSTTTTSTTTTSTPQPQRTTPTTEPESGGEKEETEEESSVEVDLIPLDDLLAGIEVPVIDIDAVVADYARTEFPAYTPRFGKRSTLEVVELLQQRGLAPEQQAQVMAPFPVNGPASYTDDWGAPRHSPSFHLHEGTDIFAARGTPVIATMDGTVSRVTEGTAVGGNVVYLKLSDGTYFYYAHLDEISPLIYAGMPVKAGQVLGTVGSTGNAEGTMPHLHFEIHPGGGDPVPPAPYLDAWLASALEEARGVAGANAAPPPFPVPLPGATPSDATILPAQPASFGRESTGILFFILPGALVLWWRRRKMTSILADIRNRAGGAI